MNMKRGAFIVLEGCDRCGKSTQAAMLFKELQARGVKVKHMGFPMRNSSIGKMINSYLTNKQELPDECIHLLFAANRWEYKNEMKKLLESGTTLIVDRYSYSGAAYSAAKGLDLNWCMSPEKGLLQPDAVFYLKTAIENLTDRGNFGEERYEKKEFQHKVAYTFERIYEKERSYWFKVDASLSKDSLCQQMSEKILQILYEVQEKPLKDLH